MTRPRPRVARRQPAWEVTVALVSAVLFAMLHIGSFFAGQGPVRHPQVFYAFGFGLRMYLALRITRNLIRPRRQFAAGR